MSNSTSSAKHTPVSWRRRLNPNETDPVVLWTEIARLQAEIEGPIGFDTWKDAALHERLKVRRTELRLQAHLDELTPPVRDVLIERRSQINRGYTLEHDDEHGDGELANAAAVYANPEIWNVLGAAPVGWPWHPSSYKPSTRREDLVKAAALLFAAIECHDRAAIAKAQGGAS